VIDLLTRKKNLLKKQEIVNCYTDTWTSLCFYGYGDLPVVDPVHDRGYILSDKYSCAAQEFVQARVLMKWRQSRYECGAQVRVLSKKHKLVHVSV